jgi:hypothetical protein
MREVKLIMKTNYKIYDGHVFSSKKTSRIPGGRCHPAAPPIRKMVKDGVIKPGMTVLDYGCGKENGRNAIWLREQGVTVYAYDLYHGVDNGDGWNIASNTLPAEDTKFDLVFSCYVLNVVPLAVEEEIIETASKYSDVVYHIIREDVYSSLKKSIYTNKWAREFWNEFDTDGKWTMEFFREELPKEVVTSFLEFGVRTGEDEFQRISYVLGCERVWGETSGYGVYKFIA